MDKARGSSLDSTLPRGSHRDDPDFCPELLDKIVAWEAKLRNEAGFRHMDNHLGNIFTHKEEDGESASFTYIDCESIIWSEPRRGCTNGNGNGGLMMVMDFVNDGHGPSD